MPREAEALTAATVKTAAPGRYGDGNGLYLVVRPTKARFWVFRYTPRGGENPATWKGHLALMLPPGPR